MYRKELYDSKPDQVPEQKPDQSLMDIYIAAYGVSSGMRILANVVEDDEERAVGFVGMLRFRNSSSLEFVNTKNAAQDKHGVPQNISYMPVVAFKGNWNTENLEYKLTKKKNETFDAHEKSWNRVARRKKWIKMQLDHFKKK